MVRILLALNYFKFDETISFTILIRKIYLNFGRQGEVCFCDVKMKMVVRGDLQKFIKALMYRHLMYTFEIKMSKYELNVPKFHEIRKMVMKIPVFKLLFL